MQKNMVRLPSKITVITGVITLALLVVVISVNADEFDSLELIEQSDVELLKYDKKNEKAESFDMTLDAQGANIEDRDELDSLKKDIGEVFFEKGQQTRRGSGERTKDADNKKDGAKFNHRIQSRYLFIPGHLLGGLSLSRPGLSMC